MSSIAIARDPKADATPVETALVAALANFTLDPARSYTAQVHDALQQAILRGVLPPRAALSEATIASLISVSRTPVREMNN